jgi:hypothetical protein
MQRKIADPAGLGPHQGAVLFIEGSSGQRVQVSWIVIPFRHG